jgi:hypothetical protein
MHGNRRPTGRLRRARLGRGRRSCPTARGREHCSNLVGRQRKLTGRIDDKLGGGVDIRRRSRPERRTARRRSGAGRGAGVAARGRRAAERHRCNSELTRGGQRPQRLQLGGNRPAVARDRGCGAERRLQHFVRRRLGRVACGGVCFAGQRRLGSCDRVCGRDDRAGVAGKEPGGRKRVAGPRRVGRKRAEPAVRRCRADRQRGGGCLPAGSREHRRVGP